MRDYKQRFKSLGLALCCLSLLTGTHVEGAEEESLYGLSIYGARMTSNHIDEFASEFYNLDFERSFLVTVALSRRLVRYKDLISLEVEGQVVRHFYRQDHWEFNGLIAARWEAFPWDHVVDTSVAVGTGPSYATAEPIIEEEKNGETDRLLAYLLVELELALPDHPELAFITRIHHRSNAWGLVADDGASNALAIGLKYKF